MSIFIDKLLFLYDDVEIWAFGMAAEEIVLEYLYGFTGSWLIERQLFLFSSGLNVSYDFFSDCIGGPHFATM